MTGTEKEMTDLELDRLLAATSTPIVPANFEHRFMQRLRALEPISNVVQFPTKRAVVARRVFAPWPLAAALAASLVIGFWVGTGDPVNNLIDTGLSATALNDAPTDFGPAGLDDLLSLGSDTAS